MGGLRGPSNKGSVIDYAAFKSKLIEQREALEALVATGAEAAEPVELDQSRVGRLSRMDAMQAQAMSIETKRRREIQLVRIETALKRIAADAFGDCLRCGEPINIKRLEFDPSVPLCIGCAGDNEA